MSAIRRRIRRRHRHRPRCRLRSDGSFAGFVRNCTVGKTASMVLRFVRSNNGEISGAISIGPELVGSGGVTGSIAGTRITFSSDNPRCRIAWSGSLLPRRITGTYVVVASTTGTTGQAGVWSVAA